MLARKGQAVQESELPLPSLFYCGRPGFDPGGGKIPWRRERLPTPVFWLGEVHGVAKNRTRLSLPKSVPSSAFLLDFPLISVATLE